MEAAVCPSVRHTGHNSALPCSRPFPHPRSPDAPLASAGGWSAGQWAPRALGREASPPCSPLAYFPREPRAREGGRGGSAGPVPFPGSLSGRPSRGLFLGSPPASCQASPSLRHSPPGSAEDPGAAARVPRIPRRPSRWPSGRLRRGGVCRGRGRAPALPGPQPPQQRSLGAAVGLGLGLQRSAGGGDANHESRWQRIHSVGPALREGVSAAQLRASGHVVVVSEATTAPALTSEKGQGLLQKSILSPKSTAFPPSFSS